ncbi:hypothetical protein P171DRAFT_437016 [Karstenula rhodostoma CBS 690.94]|uniref:CFEM domain-containing protein n=1 Tax=Karstenula rhodostoma CBS 690.94 TaxID=1392251 RepID=A0A9P4P811_9PLEO|nr:hypothetical protein P171DRAFT_437016 [Karstenula rhodostoma CBS 690.94]
MFLSHSSWLCILLPTLIAATPHKTAPARPKRSLPPSLQQQVPACAQPCLQTSLSEQFPFACTTPVDLSCLCSRYSFNGQTLGEAAVGCIYTSCSTYHGATSAYNICLGQRYAVAPTLTALTVVARTSSTPASMTSSRPITITTFHTTPKTSSTPQSRTSNTETVIADSVSLVPSATSTTPRQTTAEVTTTSLPAADPPKTMNTAQIVGLAVAVGAAFVIAIVLMGLTIFLRRRRERKRGVPVNEKEALSPGPSTYSSRYSLPFAPESSVPDPPNQFLMPPPLVHKMSGRSIRAQYEADAVPKPLKLNGARSLNAASAQPAASSNASPDSIHPLLRPLQKPLGNTSSSSVPLEQIGLAITVEPPWPATSQSKPMIQPLVEENKHQRPTISRRNADLSQRPDSVMTQTTLFEEDDFRRESKLLPAPPQVPIPPIRTLQPSRPLPSKRPIQTAMESTTIRRVPRQSELFLDIPVRYSRSQLLQVATSQSLPRGKRESASALHRQPPSGARKSEHIPRSADSEVNHGDIPDYYFTTYDQPRTIHSVSPGNAGKQLRSKADQTYRSAKPKRSSSNVSRATSRASTNIRDSWSSQTSFETADPDDPTPEDDEGEKRFQNGRLSPVAESPIHKLRYPKVPRTSNQLVPRSPKSPQSQASKNSPRGQLQPSSLLVKRKGEQGALKLGSPFRSGSPDAQTASEIRRYRHHLRSSSVETFNPARNSERSTRTQSSLWPKSPAMFEPDVVKPLTIRKTQLLQTPTEDMQVLKSPVWVPRLTPTRQGDDLFINVTYSKPGQPSSGTSSYIP